MATQPRGYPEVLALYLTAFKQQVPCPWMLDAEEAEGRALLDVMQRAERLLAARQRRADGLAWFAGATALATYRDFLRAVLVGTPVAESRLKSPEPLGLKMEQTLGLDREIVLTPRANWRLFSWPPFEDPQAAVVIYNVGRYL